MKKFLKALSRLKRFIFDLYFKYFSPNLVLVGSMRYGGWLLPREISCKLSDYLLVSCGVGEEISFDLSLLSFGLSQAILVDPTPRAVKHYEDVVTCIQQRNFNKFQAYRSYIANIKYESFASRVSYLPNAIVGDIDGDTPKLIKLFYPKNPEHVSCSLVRDVKSDSYFTCETLTLSDILKDKESMRWILKLDIEGAEWDVLFSLHKLANLPDLLLVELHTQYLSSDDADSRINKLCAYLSGIGFMFVAKRHTDYVFRKY